MLQACRLVENGESSSRQVSRMAASRPRVSHRIPLLSSRSNFSRSNRRMFIDISMTEGSSLRPSHITVPDFAIRLYHTLFSVNDVRNAPEICFIFSFRSFPQSSCPLLHSACKDIRLVSVFQHSRDEDILRFRKSLINYILFSNGGECR